MSFSCTNQQGCPVILDSKCVIYEGENLLYIGVNTNDNYRTALENINTVIGNLILTGGITELTGDVVAVGPGVTVATLATVNSTPGQYGSSTAIPKLTVDGKGRITAITTDPVFIPSGALSFIGDVTGTGNTGSNTTLTLATVNNNVFINNSFLKFAVNAKGLITSATPVNFSDIDAALGYTPYSTTNPANYISRLGLSASSPLAYNNVTGNFTIQQATSTTDGYLSSVNWNTFNSKQPAGNYITDLTGEATATGPGSANVTLDNGAVTAKVLTGVNITGGNVVDTDTILTAFGKLQNQINSLIGSSIYKGTWNAATNTPTLTSGVGTRGWYYIVNTYGTTNLDGVAEWHVGDWAIFDGTAWQKVDTTDAVVSVNGQVGAVSLTTDNIPEGATNRYFTNTRARQAFSAGTGLSYDDNTGIFSSTITQYTDALARQAISLTTTGTSGAATYNNTTGVLNIPNYSTDLSGYVPYTGATGSVNLGLNNLTANNVFGETSLNIKVLPSGSVFSTGYSTLSSLAGKFTMAQEPTSGNLKAFTFDFSAWATNTSRTYTLPDLSGTLALLEGTQTFTGDKTFNGAIDFNTAININNTFNLRNNLVGSTLYTNFSILKSGSLQTLQYLFSTANSSRLVFNDAANYTYTFPTTSGTLALTSQLPTYGNITSADSSTMTISGGTGAIIGSGVVLTLLNATATNAGIVNTGTQTFAGIKTFSDSLRADTGFGLKYGSFVSTSGYLNLFSALVGSTMTLNLKDGTGGFESALTFTNTANRNYTFPNADGTIALTSDIPSLAGYVPTSRTITINGTTQDLSANRSWTISATGGVTSFNTRTGAVTLSSADVTGALGFTPYNATNPSGYITSSGTAAAVSQTVGAGSEANLVYSQMADNDFFRIRVGGASNAGWAEIATADDGNEPIYVRQYTGVFSSLTRTATLLDGSGNTSFPGTVTAPTFSGSLSGNATSATTASTATNSSQLNGISSTQIFNNMGNNHGTYQDFNSVGNFGVRYMQGSTNGPQSGQFYGFTLGLGNEYGYGTYGSQFYWLRNTSNPYIWIRSQENGSWTSWTKAAAGYADSAGTAGNVSSISSAVGGSYTWTGINQFQTNNGGQAVNNSNTPSLQAFSTGNNSAFMSFHKGGVYAVNFGLDNDNILRIGGWSAGANRLQLDMSGNLTMAGDVTAYSDARVKENVETIKNALDKVLALRGVSYNRTDSDDKKTKIGVIAQETLPILPEVVNQDNDGMYNVSYGNMGGLFIEAFKEQQKKIDAQDKIIEELKTIINGFTK